MPQPCSLWIPLRRSKHLAQGSLQRRSVRSSARRRLVWLLLGSSKFSDFVLVQRCRLVSPDRQAPRALLPAAPRSALTPRSSAVRAGPAETTGHAYPLVCSCADCRCSRSSRSARLAQTGRLNNIDATIHGDRLAKLRFEPTLRRGSPHSTAAQDLLALTERSYRSRVNESERGLSRRTR